jgi:hypothetical protein
MADPRDSPTARCVHCRSDVSVPERYAHGDHIRCGACGTDHRVVRGERLVRLVIGDATPLREALAQNERLVERLGSDLARARGSFGIGSTGIGIGVIFVIYQLALKEAAPDVSLLANAVGIALVSGALLEAANFFFFAKRQAMTRISAEIEEARQEGLRLRQQIRDASRF